MEGMRNVSHKDIFKKEPIFDKNGKEFEVTHVGMGHNPGIRSVDSLKGKKSWEVPFKCISYSELYTNYFVKE